MRRIATGKLAFLALTLIAPATLFAYTQTPDASSAEQTYVPTMTFDVASIRESLPSNSFMVRYSFAGPHSGTMTVTNFGLMNLISVAYHVRPNQMVGVPDSPAMFNIQAKSDSATEERLASLSKEQIELEHRHMIQALLAERFKLKVHWEDREGPIFNLVVAKGGLKMKDGKGDTPGPEEVRRWGDIPVPPIYQQGNSREGFDLVAHGCSMANLIPMLASQSGRPVTDKTGLTGAYSFILHYHGALLADRKADDLDPVPPLDVAIQEQLGLKLESAKGPIRFLVVDHIEKPSEN